MSLIDGFPMHKIVVTDGCIQASAQGYIDLLLRLLHSYRIADQSNMLVGQAREAFNRDEQAHTVRAFPAHSAVQHSVGHIKRALILQDLSPVEAETLAVHKQLEGQPVGRVRQFLARDRHGIEDAVEQRRGVGTRKALFKGAACAEVAIANGVDRLLAVELFRGGIKAILMYLPEAHRTIPPGTNAFSLFKSSTVINRVSLAGFYW